MPDSTNTHLAGVQNLGDGGPSGTNVGASSTDLIADYGVTPKVQSSNIVDITGTVSLTTTVNEMLAIMRLNGDIAAA